MSDETGQTVFSDKRFYYGDANDDCLGRPLYHVGERALLKREETLVIADTTVGRDPGQDGGEEKGLDFVPYSF